MRIFSPNTVPLFLGDSGIGVVVDLLPAQINTFDVYYLENFLETEEGIDIRWSPIYDNDVVEYRLYRSLDQSPTFENMGELELLDTFGPDELHYIHETGNLSDYYGISTVDSIGNESRVTSLKSATSFVPPLCHIKGKIINLQGARRVDQRVVARLVTSPLSVSVHSSVSTKEVSVLTGEDGKFSLPVIQGAEIILLINDTQISDPIKVPNQPSVAFDSLDIFPEYKFQDVPATSTSNAESVDVPSEGEPPGEDFDEVPELCLIKGKVVSLDGQLMEDILVKAKIVNPPQTMLGHSSVSIADVKVFTGEDGKFSLPVLRGAKIILSIAETQISDPILVPDMDEVAFDSLDIYAEYKLKDFIV